jgi:hypothetical protein
MNDQGRNKKESILASSVAAAFAAGLAFVVMAFLGLSNPSEVTSLFFLQTLLFGCIFTVFNFLISRFFKWVYS